MLVTDACADRGRERHEAALALYGDYMYELRSVESLKRELEEEQLVESDGVIKKKKGIMMEHENEGVSSIRKVSVALPSYKDDVGDKKMMIKSESNDSLTSATSCDYESVSSIEDHGDNVGQAAVAKE